MNASSPYVNVYRRADVTMVRGQGMYLFDAEGRRYLDCAAGIAVNALGHAHPHLVQALQQQAERLWHCSNNYKNEQLERYAARLVAVSPLEKVFFCSSGAEAVDSAIKFIRRSHHMRGTGKSRIITFQGGFHGRAISCISAGGNAAAREGYAPLLEGFDQVAFNDIHAVKAVLSDQTAAILLEPVQGEGGVYPAERGFLEALRALCDAHGLLLAFDEVQCGFGRCGTLFTQAISDVKPDIITCAKGIGGGFPLAAVLVSDAIAQSLTPGCHGSTYGSNPLAMAVGNAVLDVMLEDGFFEQVQQVGAQLKALLTSLASAHEQIIQEVRGMGLMLGVQMRCDARAFAEALRRNGLLVAPAYGDVLRFVPPLIMQEQHAHEAAEIFGLTLAQVSK